MRRLARHLFTLSRRRIGPPVLHGVIATAIGYILLQSCVFVLMVAAPMLTNQSFREIQLGAVIISISIGVLAARKKWKDIARVYAERARLCPACGYDLRASPDRCPECGTLPTA